MVNGATVGLKSSPHVPSHRAYTSADELQALYTH